MAKASSVAALRLAARARTVTALHARMSPNASASAREMTPRGIGRRAVRVITASISASYHMLNTPAAPPPAAIARIATNPRSGSGRVGAIINPTSAVNTASTITRGFIKMIKSGSRAANLEREANQTGDKGKTAIFMEIPQPGYSFATVLAVFATQQSLKARVNAAKSRQIFQNARRTRNTVRGDARIEQTETRSSH